MLNLTIKADEYVTVTTPDGEELHIILCGHKISKKQVMLGFQGSKKFSVSRPGEKWLDMDDRVSNGAGLPDKNSKEKSSHGEIQDPQRD